MTETTSAILLMTQSGPAVKFLWADHEQRVGALNHAIRSLSDSSVEAAHRARNKPRLQGDSTNSTAAPRRA